MKILSLSFCLASLVLASTGSLRVCSLHATPPISGNVGHGNGQYFLHTSIPLRTIRMITELFSPAYIKKANQIREKSNAREAKQSLSPDEVKKKK